MIAKEGKLDASSRAQCSCARLAGIPGVRVTMAFLDAQRDHFSGRRESEGNVTRVNDTQTQREVSGDGGDWVLRLRNFVVHYRALRCVSPWRIKND